MRLFLYLIFRLNRILKKSLIRLHLKFENVKILENNVVIQKNPKKGVKRAKIIGDLGQHYFREFFDQIIQAKTKLVSVALSNIFERFSITKTLKMFSPFSSFFM
jgi:hypothetical protein